ncbi:MAG: hypothetical protein REI95_11995 [Oxalicibacterium faecigallinarum]|uniref:hypothetical protein n=1 Tax=Oxalicibacterium faecigallinarum TaxID=573741 RepID=UPI0028097537|nr:hypothetical protein [Oxalicibacterium faecigallinarum]MDQ7970356.1 hypothetical protein [Oxalicibacterium faecigallinarum]
MPAVLSRIPRSIIVAVLLMTGIHASAQTTKEFVVDSLYGGQKAFIELEWNINQLAAARELAEQIALIKRCKNYRTIQQSPDFDIFSENLRNAFNKHQGAVISRLDSTSVLAAIFVQNSFTDDEIRLIHSVMARQEYTSAVNYLAFNKAMEMIKESISIKTGEPEPWMAARALHFIKENALYPLLISTLSPTEQAVVQSSKLDSLNPVDVMKEVTYTKELISLFDQQLEKGELLNTLPASTRVVVTIIDTLQIDKRQAEGVLHVLARPSHYPKCKSSNKENCIQEYDWENEFIALQKSKDEKYKIGEEILEAQISSLCKK